MRIRPILQIFAVVGVLFLPMLALIPAEASVDFTCPSGVMCVYPGDDFTGNYGSAPGEIVPFTTITPNEWVTFASLGYSNPNPGSINNNTSLYCAFVYSFKLSSEVAEQPKSKDHLDNDYGYIFVTGTINGNCPTNQPPPPS